MPLPSSSRMSMTITSGRSRSAVRTASEAVSASATTCRSSVAASMARMPLRTSSWSSTSMTRTRPALSNTSGRSDRGMLVTPPV
jgi:hypothetical protein